MTTNSVKLSLNVKKTKFMFILKGKTLPHNNLSINNVIIENFPKFKYLGIMIGDHLSWIFHIEVTGLKVLKAIGIINHLRL